MAPLWILAYIAVASIVLFWTARLDKQLDNWSRLDDGAIYVIIAGLWPIEFPIFLIYFMEQTRKEDE